MKVILLGAGGQLGKSIQKNFSSSTNLIEFSRDRLSIANKKALSKAIKQHQPDFVINADGSPNTAHSTNPVPCFALNTGFEKIENGILGDIAPTILKIMGVEIPTQMTGNILIK